MSDGLRKIIEDEFRFLLKKEEVEVKQGSYDRAVIQVDKLLSMAFSYMVTQGFKGEEARKHIRTYFQGVMDCDETRDDFL